MTFDTEKLNLPFYSFLYLWNLILKKKNKMLKTDLITSSILLLKNPCIFKYLVKTSIHTTEIGLLHYTYLLIAYHLSLPPPPPLPNVVFSRKVYFRLLKFSYIYVVCVIHRLILGFQNEFLFFCKFLTFYKKICTPLKISSNIKSFIG